MSKQAPSIADYYLAERPEFVSFLKDSGRYQQAIDIGCAGGRLGMDLLRTGIVDACDGIEPHAPAAEEARSHLRQVWTGSLEENLLRIDWQKYDLLTMADVLEHLTDPWTALRELHKRTADTCTLALSVPNVRHYQVVFPLLFKGQFRYGDHGIMDRTHLHFFSRSSLEETLSECGWRVQHAGSHMKSRYRRAYVPTRLLEPFVAVQHLVIASKK